MTRHCKCVFLRIAFQVCIPLTDPLFLLCRHTAWHLSTWHLTKIAATAYPDIMLLKPLLSNTKAHRWCQINERSKIVLYIHIYVYSIYIYIRIFCIYKHDLSLLFPRVAESWSNNSNELIPTISSRGPDSLFPRQTDRNREPPSIP